MENEKTLEELKAEAMLRYGLTEEQVDNLVAAICRLYDTVKELVEKIAAAALECLQKYAADFQEAMKQFDAETFAELIERLRDATAYAYINSLPTYNRADTRNAQYNARLKGYKSKYLRSAAIRAPKRSARSCC